MEIKIIFFAFKHRYRFKDLNNFLHSRFYGKYFLINLSGPLKHWLAKILIKLKIGIPISFDGKPLLKENTKGLNFFIRGTKLNIPTNFRLLKNNVVSITHPLLDNEDVFQVYPLNIKKTHINKNPKIIFMSSVNIDINNEEEQIWLKYKKNILEDFTIIDQISFWQKCLPGKEIMIIHSYYKIFKILLRFEIIKHLKEKYKKKLIIVGSDWNKYFIESLPSNYNIKENNELYRGNICLDTGSLEGSSSLYSRSNQIIESGGLIIQCAQIDFKNQWNGLSDKILFTNLKNLDFVIERMLNNDEFSNNTLNDIYNNFLSANKLIENNFDKFIEKTNY